MRKFIISALALIALTSCSKSTIEPDNSSEIRLSAGVPTVSVQGKAPVTSGTFTAAISGWESTTTADYSAAATWSATSMISVNPIASAIVLTASQSYNADNDVKTFMQAWYPAGTLTNGVVSFANVAGAEDVMIAAPVSGSKSDVATKTLAFNHETTQIKFMVIKGVGLAAGTTIKKIEIIDAQLPIGITLATTPVAVTYAAAAPLTVSGLTTPVEITATPGVAAGDPVMIKPMAGNSLKLNVTTSQATYNGVVATIKDDAAFVAGKAYTISLTFSQSGITNLTGSVTNWTTGAGTGTVE